MAIFPNFLKKPVADLRLLGLDIYVQNNYVLGFSVAEQKKFFAQLPKILQTCNRKKN